MRSIICDWENFTLTRYKVTATGLLSVENFSLLTHQKNPIFQTSAKIYVNLKRQNISQHGKNRDYNKSNTDELSGSIGSSNAELCQNKC